LQIIIGYKESTLSGYISLQIPSQYLPVNPWQILSFLKQTKSQRGLNKLGSIRDNNTGKASLKLIRKVSWLFANHLKKPSHTEATNVIHVRRHRHMRQSLPSLSLPWENFDSKWRLMGELDVVCRILEFRWCCQVVN